MKQKYLSDRDDFCLTCQTVRRSFQNTDIRRCRGGHAVWTLVSTTCSLHLTVSTLAAAYVARSDLPPCAYAEVSPGVEWLVGRELVQILGARLLVSALRMGESLVISI